ncbi:MAG: TonB-dependent receptor [Flavobacteriia bacterium]|nr:MAG: TonB-dependent receptor [Flavobacteriia bacterium]
MKQVFLFAMLLAGIVNQAQSVNGKVIDQMTEQTITDVLVTNLTNNKTALTTVNGTFSIEATADDILQFTHLNYSTLTQVATDGMQVTMASKFYALDEILITSSPLDDITHSIMVMDEIKQGSQPRNAADLFSDIPGFYLQKRSAMSLEPSLRSFKYEQLNIKFDGSSKTTNACPNRMDPITAHMTPEDVQKIEVVKGPYSVRFGQTFGGVVNMVTRSKPSATGLHGTIQTGYETNGNNTATGAKLSYAQPEYDFTVNGEYRNFGDYTDGNGIKVPADFITTSYAVKAGWNPTGKQRILLDWRQKFGSDIDHAGLPMDSPKDDSYIIALDYSYHDISDKLSKLSFKSYHSFVTHLMSNANRPNVVKLEAQTPVTAHTYGGKFELTLTPLQDLIVYTGLDADVIKRNGKRFRLIKINPMGVTLETPVEKIDRVWQDAATQDYGVFAESTYKLNNHMSLTGGLRLDFVSGQINDPAPDTQGSVAGTVAAGFKTLYGEGFDRTHETTLGGNLGLKYDKDKFQVQLTYGLGQRSTSMTERYIYHFSIGTDGYEYVGNPLLKPEKNHQVEMAFSHKTSKTNLGASIFYSRMKDYISARYMNGDSRFVKVFMSKYDYAKQFINVDAYQVGFDAFFNWNILDNLQLKTGIAYTKADNETFDEPLAQMAPLMTRLGLKYETSKFWIDLRQTIAAKQNRLSESFGETEITPGYTTLDLRLGFEPFKGFKVGGAILNIFDESYYYHNSFSYSNTSDHTVGDRIYEPGRNFSLFASYKF